MNECDRCGKDLAGTRPWRQVTGWVQPRGARGGANQIIGQKPSGKQMCEGCIAILRGKPVPIEGQLTIE